MTKFNVGDSFKYISDIDKGFFTKNQNYEVLRVGSESVGLKDNHGQTHRISFDYLNEHFKFNNSKPTKNQRITALENEVAELRPLKQEVAELKLIVHELRGKKSIEPSTTVEDIIEFEGQQYKKVDRGAHEGDYVSVSFANGECFKPNKIYGPVYKSGTKLLVRADSSTGERDYEEALVYNDMYGRTLETVDVYELIKSKPQTPNQQRAAIIEKAKEFVKNIVGEYDTFNTTVGRYKDQCVRPIFHVNEKKCAITVLIYGAFSKKLIFKGLAKCNPPDVFNEHIGKAIALGRALGLDVSEFEQAVQPTEFVVGQIVNCFEQKVYELGSFRESAIGLFGCSKAFNIKGKGTWLGDNQITKIINDTKAIYGGVE